MYLKFLKWNIGGVGSKAREIRETTTSNRSDVVELSELENTTMAELRDSWPGSKVEILSSRRKDVRAAPRVG